MTLISEIALWALAICWFVGFWTTVVLLMRRSERREIARRQALAEARSSIGPDLFLDHFRRRDVDERIVVTVYGYFRKWMGMAKFPVIPEDDIEEIHRIDPEDLSDNVLRWLACWSLRLPTQGELQAQKPVKTIEDLVLYLATLRKATPKARRTPKRSAL
ncbi:MAG: hypothetical protein U0793_00920 [Gemmataceae bacterium]